MLCVLASCSSTFMQICFYNRFNIIVWKQSLTDLNVYAIQNGHGLGLHFYIYAGAIKNYGSFDVEFFIYALLTIFYYYKVSTYDIRF